MQQYTCVSIGARIVSNLAHSKSQHPKDQLEAANSLVNANVDVRTLLVLVERRGGRRMLLAQSLLPTSTPPCHHRPKGQKGTKTTNLDLKPTRVIAD